MADSFLQAGEFFLVHGELVNKHIEISSLIAEIHPEPERVIDDDERENASKSKDTVVCPFIVSNRSEG